MNNLDLERRADYEPIKNLSGIEHCTSLDTLNLFGNQLSDIRLLSGLTELLFLQLGDNRVEDISPLASLSKLN